METALISRPILKANTGKFPFKELRENRIQKGGKNATQAYFHTLPKRLKVLKKETGSLPRSGYSFLIKNNNIQT